MFVVENLLYEEELIYHYQAFNKLPGFVLLESADRTNGRYDILSAYPYDNLTIPYGMENYTDVYEKLQYKLYRHDPISDIPFQGGAIGYFSYDFASELIGIKKSKHESLKSLPIVKFNFYDWAVVVDHHKKVVHLVNANSQPETSGIVADIKNQWGEICNLKGSFSLTKNFSSIMSQDEYQNAFEKIYSDLESGRAYQVNLTREFIAEYSGEPWEIFKSIRKCNPVAYSAFMRDEWGDILSFSPERFILFDKQNILTSPIKGTCKRSKDKILDNHLKDELKACPKNRAENVMIVDLMRNDLGKIAQTGSVSVTSLFYIQSITGVHHLVSDITAFCDENITAIDVFSSCFPGGSITGAPKREAMNIIAEREKHARGVYCGSIGYFSCHGRADSNIAIRTMVAADSKLHMAAGGGIVIDSSWEGEFAECFTKISAITDNL